MQARKMGLVGKHTPYGYCRYSGTAKREAEITEGWRVPGIIQIKKERRYSWRLQVPMPTQQGNNKKTKKKKRNETNRNERDVTALQHSANQIQTQQIKNAQKPLQTL